MSTAFWIELLLALIGFGCFIALFIKVKLYIERRAQAAQLREILVPELQALLPVLAAQSRPTDLDADSYSHNTRQIARFHAYLSALIAESNSMFREEYAALRAFSDALELLLPSILSDAVPRGSAENLVLLGQRAVLEMLESGK